MGIFFVFAGWNLRRMMEVATGYRRSRVEGRWVIETRHQGKPWAVAVEPIPEEAKLVVVSAFDVWNG